MSEITGLSTAEVLRALKEAGMHGLPGGGAEMLVEGVRRDVSPKKGGPEQWIRIMREAQSLDLITSATNVFGVGEGASERVEHLVRVRDMQDEAIARGERPFTSFIAWPVQLETNSFGRRNRGQNRVELGAGPSEYLRHVAVARLMLDVVDHIQASWPTMGVDVAQMALLGGADDIGSTMMEENVVSASGPPKSRPANESSNLIRRAGLTPRRRNSRYELLDTPHGESEDLRPGARAGLGPLGQRHVAHHPNFSVDVSTTCGRFTGRLILCAIEQAAITQRFCRARVTQSVMS